MKKLPAEEEARKLLTEAGFVGNELETWLASPSGWLSGEIPAEVLRDNPERGLRAVRARIKEMTRT